MSPLRIFLMAIGIIISLFLIVALFLPSTAHIERTITITAPADSVFALVSDFNHYIEWNPFSAMEPSAQNTLAGQPGTTGHSWAWAGDTIGSGKLTILDIIPGKTIRSELIFSQPDTFRSTEIWQFQPEGAATVVTWINESQLNYPIGRVLGLFLDGMMGPEFEKGLRHLKEYSESRNPN